MEIQAKTLFVHNENGRMTFVNDLTDPKTYPAPRFFLGFTTSGFICHFRDDMPQQLCTQLQKLIHSKPPTMNGQTFPTCAQEIEKILNSHGRIEQIECGPAFCFPEHLKLTANVVRVERHNESLFNSTFPEMVDEVDDIQPCMAFLSEGKAVSVCQSVRKSPYAEEAGVDTLEAYRGQGYAPLVVAGWAEAIKEKGKIPLYSTSWKNRSSQRVAEKLGLIQYGVDYHVTSTQYNEKQTDKRQL